MATTIEAESDHPTPTSSPCMLHELGPDGAPRVDSQQVTDVARWRKAERERLISSRMALASEIRAAQTLAIVQDLDSLVGSAHAQLVSVYWPIRGEPDLRAWMHALAGRGVRVALPVAMALGQPLTFREWHPHARLARGLWNIPYPADGTEVVPNIVVAPLVGFDREWYRLGYGGGFFDRTLPRLSPKPMAIGVGYPGAALRTIFPQPHDVPMDWIVTGSGATLRCSESSNTTRTP